MAFNIYVICFIFVTFFGISSCQDESTTIDFGFTTSKPDCGNRIQCAEAKIQDAMRKVLDPLDPIYLPLLPTLSFNDNNAIDISLSMTDINMTGLTTVQFTILDLPVVRNTLRVKLFFPRLLMQAGQYSAGGHIANMPFTGESYCSVSFEDVSVTLAVDFYKHIPPIYCAQNETTVWSLDIFKPVINFDQLNPGTDQGELVNTLFGAFIPDITDSISALLNLPNGNLHEFLDNKIVSTINSFTCKNVFEDYVY